MAKRGRNEGARKSIPIEIETSVLVNSRRRCCICYGLWPIIEETGVKAGQIAHLDRDPSNSTEDNLAFLCLEHHSAYDSTPSQGKGFTKDEVKYYREALYKTLADPKTWQ